MANGYSYSDWNDTSKNTYAPRYSIDVFYPDNTNEMQVVQSSCPEVIGICARAIYAKMPGADIMIWEWNEAELVGSVYLQEVLESW